MKDKCRRNCGRSLILLTCYPEEIYWCTNCGTLYFESGETKVPNVEA